MPNSQSHLFSLAQLLESAEQRHSSLPPPAPPTPARRSSAEDDSGLIDILAMQARAREAAARPSSRTPLPVVASRTSAESDARRAYTDPDLAAASSKRKQRQAVLGGVAAGVGLIAFAIAFASSVQATGAHHAAATQVTAPVAPLVPLVAAAPPTEAAPAPAPPDAVAAAPADPPKAKAKSKKKSSHAPHPSHAGPSLMKVISGGTAP